MASIINGTFTIKEVLLKTNQSQFKTRFKNAKRDQVRLIRVRKIQFFTKDRKKAPSILYEIITQSKPFYYPYKKTGKRRSPIKHEYDLILQADRLSLNTPYWRGRVGKLKKWEKAPQDKVKTIRRETLADWKKKAELQYDTKKEQKEYLDELKVKHKKKAKYLDDGDYNSRVNGLNGDFIFRFSYVWKKYGHLYQRGGYIENRPSSLNSDNIMAFPKHFIVLINELMNRGVLKDD